MDGCKGCNAHLLSLTPIEKTMAINPYETNGLSDPYQLYKSTFIFKGIRRSNFLIYISFFDEIHVSKENSPDEMSPIVASHLGLFCLHMSQK